MTASGVFVNEQRTEYIAASGSVCIPLFLALIVCEVERLSKHTHATTVKP